MTKETTLLRAIAAYIDEGEAGVTQHFDFPFAGKRYIGELRIEVDEIRIKPIKKKHSSNGSYANKEEKA